MQSYLIQNSRDTSNLPVALADLKAHLSIYGTNDDDRLTALEWSAVDFIERQTNRDLIPTTWTQYSDHFPTWYRRSMWDGFSYPFFVYPYLAETPYGMPLGWGRIQRVEMDRSPVTAVTNVQYYDINNTLQSLTEGTDYWELFPTKRPAFIQPVQVWPIPTNLRPDAVQISFSSGWTVSGDNPTIPSVCLIAIKLLVAAWNENRQDFDTNGTPQSIPIGVKAMLQSISTGGYY